METIQTSLSTLASNLPGIIDVDDALVEVSDVTHDSRAVNESTIFVAVRGSRVDGHDFLAEVATRGAPAVMVDVRSDVDVPQIVVSDTRAAMGHLARAVHGFPDTTMSMIGVTGTNGKTTVCSMLEAVFREVGISVAVIGTLGARIRGTSIPLARTTPESTDLQRLLARMRDEGVTVVVMEVSSHALALHRVAGVGLDIAAYTNLSQDHLDFHGSMDEYFAEKSKLFSPSMAASAVINVGDPYGATLVPALDIPVTTIAIDGTANADHVDLVCRLVEHAASFTEIEIEGVSMRVPLPGDFNAVNAAVAYGVAKRSGISPQQFATGIATLGTVRGRMELVATVDGASIYVDYAHTPDAVATVTAAARGMTEGRVIAVVGAGGDRDRDKRRTMGAEAANNSDVVIVTTDNPRSEDPRSIADEVAAGASESDRSVVELVLDRRTAIRRAIQIAEPGDAVLILGKGHEQGQEVNGEIVPFDDATEVRVAADRRSAGER